MLGAAKTTGPAKEPTPGDQLRFAYEGPESWLRYIGIARVGVLVFVTVGAAFIRGQSGHNVGPLIFLYALGFATGIWHLREIYRIGHLSRGHTYTQVLLDFIVVAITVAFTHGPTSFFTFIFVIVVLEAGLLLGLRQGFAVSTCASIFMLAQVILLPPGQNADIDTFELWYNFLIQSLAFYLTAFVSGYWNQRLHRMQEFQREILDNMNSGFLITDAEGMVTVLNRAARQILSIPESSTGYAHVADILKLDSGGECPIVTALRSGRDFTSYEFRAIVGEKDTRLLGLTTNRIIGKDEKVSGLIASFSDLTEMDEMRQEMRKQDRLAVVGELAAGLAHEIRNPVAVIRGAVDEMHPHTGGQMLLEKLCSIALRESDHLNEIVTGFLDFAREPSMRREIFDLRDEVEEVAELLLREYGDHPKLSVETEITDTPCIVSADPSQIKQVFVNLGKNAIEAMAFDGVLSILIAKPTSGPIEVTFNDEGPGIEPDKVARIFEPFYTTKGSGVGMGLAVCSRIITAHDGTIRVSSREGGGCSMSVRLPAAQIQSVAS